MPHKVIVVNVKINVKLQILHLLFLLEVVVVLYFYVF